jgi:hypothetical protein
MINFHKDHATLVNVALVVLRAAEHRHRDLLRPTCRTQPPVAGHAEDDRAQRRGLAVYVSEGCMAATPNKCATLKWTRLGDRVLPCQATTTTASSVRTFGTIALVAWAVNAPGRTSRTWGTAQTRCAMADVALVRSAHGGEGFHHAALWLALQGSGFHCREAG